MEDDRLRGWKEIAQALHASERTVQRWERQLRLPVHRVETAKRAIVFASRSELDSWQRSADGQAASHEDATTADGAGNYPDPALAQTSIERAAAASTFRPRTRRIGMATLLVVAALALVAFYSTRSLGLHSSPLPGRRATSPERSRPTDVGSGDKVVMSVTTEGVTAKLGIRVGETGSFSLGDHPPLVFSVEPIDGRVWLHAYRMTGRELRDVAKLELKLDLQQRLALEGQTLKIRWLHTEHRAGEHPPAPQ